VPRTCERAIVVALLGLAAALGLVGCSSAGSQAPTPLEPATRARDAADKANAAIKGLQSDVASTTPDK
jgi:hypothetical protein